MKCWQVSVNDYNWLPSWGKLQFNQKLATTVSLLNSRDVSNPWLLIVNSVAMIKTAALKYLNDVPQFPHPSPTAITFEFWGSSKLKETWHFQLFFILKRIYCWDGYDKMVFNKKFFWIFLLVVAIIAGITKPIYSIPKSN